MSADVVMTVPPAELTEGRSRKKTRIHPWIIAITITIATFMELLDTSVANVALPHIAGGLGTDFDASTWILSSYLIANVIVIPLSAWFSRLFGRKNYYMGCVVVFTVSSFCCGMAPSLGWLIFFRVIQGLGGGGLAPCEQSILADSFPPKKLGAAFAFYAMTISAAPALGPTLGGWITDNLNWRWVFFINVPVGLISLIASYFVVSDSIRMKREMKKARETEQRIDLLGIVFIALALGCLEVVLDQGQRKDWLESNYIVFFLTVSLVSFVLALWWELTTPNPAVDLSLMKDRNFAVACGLYFIFGFILLGTTELIPRMLQTLFGYTAIEAGWVLGPGALLIICVTPLVVWLVRIVGVIPLLVGSFVVQGYSLWLFSQYNLATDHSSFVHARLIQAFGIALLLVPSAFVATSYLPKHMNNRASSLGNLFRNLGMSFGVAFVTTVQAQRVQVHQSFLIEHLNANESITGTRLHLYAGELQKHMTVPDTHAPAQALLQEVMLGQASMLAYLDTFWLMIGFTFVGIALVLCIKSFKLMGGLLW